MPKKQTPITPEQAADAARLAELFKHRCTISQTEFGEQFGLGTQSMVSQYLTGYRPLNVPAAVGFARGLGVLISEFSPGLAALIQEAADFTPRPMPSNISEESAAILQIVEDLPATERKRLAAVIRTITGPAVSNDEVEEKMPITKGHRHKPTPKPR